MANTIKVTGSGPFAGRTFYGTVTGVSQEVIKLKLDEPANGFLNEVFDRSSGAMIIGDLRMATDLLHIDLDDLLAYDRLTVGNLLY